MLSFWSYEKNKSIRFVVLGVCQFLNLISSPIQQNRHFVTEYVHFTGNELAIRATRCIPLDNMEFLLQFKYLQICTFQSRTELMNLFKEVSRTFSLSSKHVCSPSKSVYCCEACGACVALNAIERAFSNSLIRFCRWICLLSMFRMPSVNLFSKLLQLNWIISSSFVSGLWFTWFCSYWQSFLFNFEAFYDNTFSWNEIYASN